MPAFHCKEHFPNPTDHKRHGINRNIKHRTIHQTVPDAIGIIARDQCDDPTSPTFKRCDIKRFHREVCITPDHVHPNNHWEKCAPPNGGHHSLHIHRVSDVGLPNGDLARGVENRIYHLVDRIKPFVLSTLVKVRF